MSKLVDLIDNSLTDKNTCHSYINTYERLFSQKKNTIILTKISSEYIYGFNKVIITDNTTKPNKGMNSILLLGL